jgi:hypothetical protein
MSDSPPTRTPTQPTPRTELFPPSVAPTNKVKQHQPPEATLQYQEEQQARIGSLEAQILELRALVAQIPAQLVAAMNNTTPTPTASVSDPLRPLRTDTDRTVPTTTDSDSDPSVPTSDTDSDSDCNLASARISAEVLSLYLLQAMEPAQHSTSGSRHTTTASSLEAWLHKVNPRAREALIASVNSPGPIACRGLSVFRTELKATTAPVKATVAAVTIAALTREPNHERALHTESLIGIACGCAHMKDLKGLIKSVRATGQYDMDRIPTGSVSATPSFHRFSPANKRSAGWWEALLDLFDAFWGSSAHYNEDDLEAEIDWKAAALPGDPTGTFEQGTDSVTTLVAREALNYRAREATSQGRPFTTPSDRTRNLLAAADRELVTALLNHLQAEKLTLHSLSWGRLTAELIEVEKAVKDRKKTEGMLSYSEAAAVKPPNRPSTGRPSPKPVKPDTHITEDPPGVQPDCWNWQFMGECDFGDKCRHNHQGQAGSKRHHLATEDGTCKHFLQGTCDRGAQCKFGHPEQGDGLPKTVKPKPLFAIQNEISWKLVPGGPNAREQKSYPIRISPFVAK